MGRARTLHRAWRDIRSYWDEQKIIKLSKSAILGKHDVFRKTRCFQKNTMFSYWGSQDTMFPFKTYKFVGSRFQWYEQMLIFRFAKHQSPSARPHPLECSKPSARSRCKVPPRQRWSRRARCAWKKCLDFGEFPATLGCFTAKMRR